METAIMSTFFTSLAKTLRLPAMFGRFQQGPFRPKFSEPNLSSDEQQLVDQFSDLYYSKLDEGRGLHTIVISWMGYEMFKCPLDLWIYQEIITGQRPDLIIEIGTYKGGSTLYLAHICDLVGNGRIISIDIDDTHQPTRPKHSRIDYWLGSSIDPVIINKIKEQTKNLKNVLVILDGDHRCETVIQELRAYSDLIPVGGYLIAEDTNINGHPTYPSFGPGPWEAVDMFLGENGDFVADRTCERFLLTMNPRGYLKRVS